MTMQLAVSNQKGGVGKTTTAINLAGAFNARGKDVLFVDIDPQGNATEGLGHEEEYWNEEPNLRSVMVTQEDSIEDVIVEHEEMDLIPSNLDMIHGEAELVSEMQGRLRLKRAMEDVVDDYDVVVYDCPPSLLILTDAGLLSASNVVIPALAESTSTRALDILFDQIDTLNEQFAEEIRESAIVANRVEPDGESEEMMDWFHDTFEALPVFEIRKRVSLKRAWSSGVSIFEHDEECDMEAEYLRLADELEADL